MIDPQVVFGAFPDVKKETLEHGVSDEFPEPVDFYMGPDQEGINANTRAVSCLPLTGQCSLLSGASAGWNLRQTWVARL